ncbi:dTDP-4-dehydrorhamnose 3,5-epimerase [Enterococcus diestrammenae]|uniref:dTDP-4-dehydrorhamnose 3,5-epimerase n=2 Tax=Enterococcus TaxID=1350 RepID=A0ABV0F3X5_9ENTE|nr:dTDP-4-dehydrorhamnose 3,5-epimerase [Enterococcus diestrammenae]KAF1300368.1 dTDP-4-dehydrorhamnose 3,5-epimerase [Enterococcus diestrammenae]
MGQITKIATTLTDAYIVEPAVYGDHRGFFMESYSEADFQKAGLDYHFVQDNHSLSTQPGVLRGLHFQRGQAAQTKLVRAVTGALLDVIVDLRKGSPTYGQWESFILSASNQRQLLVPKGFAHGFLTLTPDVHFLYKCDNYYDADADGGIAFDDPTLAVNWQLNGTKAILSEKDRHHPSFKEFESHNPFVYGEI